MEKLSKTPRGIKRGRDGREGRGYDGKERSTTFWVGCLGGI